MCLNTGVARVEIHEAEAQLSQLVERAQGGEEIILTRHGVPPCARSCQSMPGASPRLQAFGEDKCGIAEDFDELPDEIAEPLGDRRTT